MRNVAAAAADHLAPYRWQPGQPGGPGRPKGSRSKLNELCLRMLAEDFAVHGEDVIRRVRERRPEAYLQAVVSLLPKQKEEVKSPFIDLTDEELEQLETFLKAARAKHAPPMIEGDAPAEAT